MKKITLTWETSFETDDEVNEFIARIARVHSQMYGMNVAESKLANTREYIGAVNTIKVIIE